VIVAVEIFIHPLDGFVLFLVLALALTTTGIVDLPYRAGLLSLFTLVKATPLFVKHQVLAETLLIGIAGTTGTSASRDFPLASGVIVKVWQGWIAILDAISF
jgi:hypothetical protein